MQKSFLRRKEEFLKKRGFGRSERQYIGDIDARMRARKIYDAGGVSIIGAEKNDGLIKIYAEILSSKGADTYRVELSYKMLSKDACVIDPEKTEHECPFTKNRGIPKTGGIPDKHVLAAYWRATEELPEICERYGFGKINSRLKPNIPSAAEAEVYESAKGIDAIGRMELAEDYRKLRTDAKKKRKGRAKAIAQ